MSRSNTRPKEELYGFNLQQSIPKLYLPLQSGDPEPEINLKAILDDIYDRAGYGFRIDYQKPAQPALDKAIQEWAIALLK